MRTRWLASGAIAMGLVAAGCGGSGDTAEPAASSTTTAATGSGSGCSVPEDDASLTSLLSLVPDTPENRGYVVVSNLRAFLDDQDATLPDPDRKVKFVDPVALFNATDLLQKAIIPADDVEDPLKAEYGISIADVDQAISAGEPPDLTELFVGSFDPAQVQSTVTSEPEWSADLEEESSDGLSFYAWGEDNETQLERRTTMRELGIGGRLMVSDSVAGFTRSTPVMEDLIEACTGAAPTLPCTLR